MSGAAIYRGYDRAALDAQYNNRARIPEYVDYFERWLAWSAETRASLPGARDVAYGDLPVETLDIFPAEEPDAPILIMIHGGYWYSLDKHHDSFVAEGCRPHGVATVVINYGLAPDYRMDERGILGCIGEPEQPFDPLIQVIRTGGLVKDRPIPLVDDVHVVRRKPEPADRARIVERVLGEDALQLQEHGHGQIFADQFSHELHRAVVVDDHPFAPVTGLAA